MAQLYTIKCPKCGKQFMVSKGVLMSWDFSQPIPKEYWDETPFNCPQCNHTMCVLDEDFRNHIIQVIYAD